MISLLRPVGRLLDLALPAACAGCGVEGDPLCRSCRPAVDARLALPPGTPLGLTDGPPEPLLQLDWCAPFAGVTRRALHALKYAGEQRLAGPLGAAVAARWRVAGAGGDLLVPVPVHASRRRERGYDQAELIAAAASSSLDVPWRPALVRARATTAQYRLDRRHRARNVHDAFEVGAEAAPGLTGRWVVLVDDVVTTGATLVACAEALLAAGASAVSAVTVARER
ncbi:MAG: ComF family protein [Candidatus Limnocylindrales bacterium]